MKAKKADIVEGKAEVAAGQTLGGINFIGRAVAILGNLADFAAQTLHLGRKDQHPLFIVGQRALRDGRAQFGALGNHFMRCHGNLRLFFILTNAIVNINLNENNVKNSRLRYWPFHFLRWDAKIVSGSVASAIAASMSITSNMLSISSAMSMVCMPARPLVCMLELI